MKSLLIIIALLLSTLSNFWIYWIFEKNFLLGELMIIETVLFFFLSLKKAPKVIPVLTLGLLLMISFYLITNHFDKNIFSPSVIDSIRVRERQPFYVAELGKIYTNRVGIYYFDNLRLAFNKISSNLFSGMDLSLYFSPRFPIDQEKLPLFLSPLFIIGFLSLLDRFKKLLIYIIPALLVSSLISLDSTLAPILMFPFITVCITQGLIKVIGFLKVYKAQL